MTAKGQLHSMSPEERSLALDVLAAAWQRLSAVGAGGEPAGESIVGAVRAAAAALPDGRPEITADFAHHVGDAAVWYLDRAVRRVSDPERDGHGAGRRALNLGWFGSTASLAELERLFAVASALNADDA